MISDFYGTKPTWELSENANRGGMDIRHWGKFKTYVAERTIGQLADQYYPKEVVRSHHEGHLHCHDYRHFTVYCVGHPMINVLTEGLRGLPGNPISKPPKSFRGALNLVADYVFFAQLEQAGAIGLGYLTLWLAPFAKRDNLDADTIHKLLREFIYRLNQRLRWGYECPFTNTSHPFQVIPEFSDLEIHGETIGSSEDYYWHIEQQWFRILLRGDDAANPFPFPIPTVLWHNRIDRNDAFDIMIDATRYRGAPYIQNLIGTNLKPTDVMAFCCRLQLDTRELEEVTKARGFFGVGMDATGSVGVVTLNLPLYAYLSKAEDDRYFELLREHMEIGVKYLLKREELVTKLLLKGAFPLFWHYIGKRNHDLFGDPFATFFRTFGVVGGHEACINMHIEDGIISKDGQRFAIRTLQFIRQELHEFAEQYNKRFNVEETPAESASYRLWMLNYQHHSEMPCFEGRSVQDCYTNSTHLPPSVDSIPFIIRHQEPLKALYTGGTVEHFDLFETPSREMTITLIDRICKRSTLPYFTLNVCYSVCTQCATFVAGRFEQCPFCKSSMDVYHRVVGYYRRIIDFNPGKQVEFRRRSHKVWT